jgi:hypothetical protein
VPHLVLSFGWELRCTLNFEQFVVLQLLLDEVCTGYPELDVVMNDDSEILVLCDEWEAFVIAL